MGKFLSIDEIRAMPGTYLKGELNPGDWALFYDAEPSSNSGKFTVARYSHSEVTTPFDRHWSMDKDYFAHCEPMTAQGIMRLTGNLSRPGQPDILHPLESS